MKNILVISKYFHPFESGSEKTTRYIIDYLSDKNYNVTLFCARGSAERLNKKAGFVSIGDNKIYKFLSAKKYLKEIADIIFGFAYILKIIVNKNIDIINVHYGESFGLPAVVLAKLFCKKSVVLWPTSSMYHFKMTENKLSFLYNRIYSYNADIFIAKGMPSRQMKTYFKIKDGRLFETVNPVEKKDYDAGNADFSNEKLGIYYLGKYNNFKRPDILLKAVYMLDKQYKEKIKVSLYGDGPYQKLIEDMKENLNLSDMVEIHPPTNDVLKVITENHIFIYPSPFEPAFSQSILESLSAGRVVICRNTEGIKRYFDSNSIIGVLPMNSKNLSMAIKSILDNRSDAEKKALRGQKIIEERFNFDYFMKQIMVHL